MYYCCAFNENFLIEQIEFSDETEVLQKALNLFDENKQDLGHSLLEKLIKEEHSLALVLSSMFSMKNETEEEFYVRHINFLNIAAVKKNSLALYSLGVYFDKGEFVEENRHKAFEYFKEAAELGMPSSKLIYGIMLFYGTGGAKQNEKEGLLLIKSAADSNVDEAMDFLKHINKKNLGSL